MLRPALAVTLSLVATDVRAGEPLTGEDFRSLSEGRTLHFTLGGLPFGSERYYSGGRSLWRTPDGSCEAGVWSQRGEDICFVYELSPEAQCWRFRRENGEVQANFIENGRPVPDTVILASIDDAPLDCPGPRVGS